MSKKLLFDLWATQPSPEAKFHGGSEYAKQVFYFLIENNVIDFECFYNPCFQLDSNITEACKINNIPIHKISNCQDLEQLVRKEGFGKLYSAMPYPFQDFNVESCRFIMTIHGLRELEIPTDKYEIYFRDSTQSKIKYLIRTLFFSKKHNNKFYNKYAKLLKIKNKQVITVSEHSKYSILNFYPYVKENEIKVIHAPIKLIKNLNLNSRNSELHKNYYLIISANRWIKNSYRTIIAFDRLISNNSISSNKRVVVAGIPDNNLLKKIKNKDQFIFLDYLDEDSLAWYFKNAYCFVYPSLNEGFGYPPVYAMNFKVPVIASAISSIPEVCNDAVLYFNPYSISEISNRIIQIENNQQLYDNLILKGTNHLSVLMNIQTSVPSEIIKTILQ